MLPALHEAPLAYVFSILVFVTSVVALYLPPLFTRLQLYPYAIWRGRRLYTLWTSLFVHGGWKHLLLNVFFLMVFMGEVEYMLVDDFGPVYGRLSLLNMIICIALLAGVASAFEHRKHIAHWSMGSSALVFGLVMFYYAYLPFGDVPITDSFWTGVHGFHISVVLFVGLTLSMRFKILQVAAIHWYGALAGWILAVLMSPATWNGVLRL
ncbi:rhomboid family intramembrane serine protease [Parapedobacter tibetensis]|uniref:rhomboid family intramembrane serine protease n=1 Tax=Parapedobacter tibetensis TaxID=2972951 RepID=UPI00214D378F|nr:rhomboid family intramembrane serine protease [Parapedobacter tibetensis]